MEVPPVPMLATAGPMPTGSDWAYEMKWDGMRLLAHIADGGITLYSRNGQQHNASYPELNALHEGVDVTDAVVDGEVIALDDDSRPSFALITRRLRAHTRSHALRLAHEAPVTYMIFDILALNGANQRDRSYRERRQLLESLGLAGPTWTIPPRLNDGAVAQQAARDIGAEGVVAKRLASRYRPGRSRDWIKTKDRPTIDLAVGGYVITAADRLSLLVGEPGFEGWQYRGRVASGITATEKQRLLDELTQYAAPTSPFTEPTAIPGVTWVHPRLVIEAAHTELTPAGRLRHPRYIRRRPDKNATEL